MTIRRWMVAVLVIAAIFGAAIALNNWLRWQRYCKLRADKHRHAKRELRVMAKGHQPQFGFDPYLSARYDRQAVYHSQMAQKWERAAGRPWEPVTLDAPPPD